MMESGQIVARFKAIANGVLLSVDKEDGYASSDEPVTFYPTLEEAVTATPEKIAAAALLPLDRNGSDF